MATKARFWLARFWLARFFAALGAAPAVLATHADRTITIRGETRTVTIESESRTVSAIGKTALGGTF